MIDTYQIAYYPSYKDWANQLWLQGWPGYLCVIITGLLGLITKNSDLIFFLLIFSCLILLFCVFGTAFYANAILEITENGLTITKNKSATYFNWPDIADIVFIKPSGREAYREIVMVIYYRVNDEKCDIEYITIESLYFNWANVRAAEIGCLVGKHLKDYTFKIHRSNFYAPVFFKRRDIMPTIYP